MNNGPSNLDISSLTTGVSKEGLRTYMEELKTNVLLEMSRELDNTNDVIQAINNCWEGQSKTRFLDNFSKIREEIKNDLALEYSNLESKLESLANGMYVLDQFGIYDYK